VKIWQPERALILKELREEREKEIALLLPKREPLIVAPTMAQIVAINVRDGHEELEKVKRVQSNLVLTWLRGGR
jgi:hypothetical protein